MEINLENQDLRFMKYVRDLTHLISSSFHRLDMTLAVAEALSPNNPPPPKKKKKICVCSWAKSIGLLQWVP